MGLRLRDTTDNEQSLTKASVKPHSEKARNLWLREHAVSQIRHIKKAAPPCWVLRSPAINNSWGGSGSFARLEELKSRRAKEFGELGFTWVCLDLGCTYQIWPWCTYSGITDGQGSSDCWALGRENTTWPAPDACVAAQVLAAPTAKSCPGFLVSWHSSQQSEQCLAGSIGLIPL